MKTPQPKKFDLKARASAVALELSESQKARIWAEEKYRAKAKVQEEIKALIPKSRYKKFVDFLQTSLGGIFISTILVGLVSFSWNSVSDCVRERNQKKETIIKMKQEISYRVFQLNRQYGRQYKTRFANDTLGPKWERWKTLVLNFKNAPEYSKGFLCMYPEFNKTNTVALMMQLSGLLPAIEGDTVKALTLRIAKNNYLPPYVDDDAEFSLLTKKLSDEIEIPTWDIYFK